MSLQDDIKSDRDFMDRNMEARREQAAFWSDYRKRDRLERIATAVLAGNLSREDYDNEDKAAAWAISQARALIAELDKEQP